ncbi:CHAP domain-containing protein [Nostoc ellipsosporum NOK]|nr:CHAP domain-containing protein [Nostoc ellipsosporum NOK]
MRGIKLLAVLVTVLLSFSAAPAQTVKDPVSRLQQVYTSQIGVREATGRNDGPEVERYLRAVGLGKGNAWCAAFVRWCFDQVGIRTPITAWSPTAYNAKNPVWRNGRLITEPRPGDVFCLWYPSLGRIAHTGFYDRRINSTVYESVEGNTNEAGSRSGDGVYRRKRSFRATYVISRWF